VEDLDNYMTSKALIDLLIDKVSSGGNLLLDIGPTADGRIPVIMQQRLADIGEWLKVNGEAIYNTRAWASQPERLPGISFTRSGKNLYVICTRWPESPVTVKGIRSAGKVSLLGSPVKVTASANGLLTIRPPVITPATMPCQHAWVFRVENVVE
jgi:alpha-L-fucosidase